MALFSLLVSELSFIWWDLLGLNAVGHAILGKCKPPGSKSSCHLLMCKFYGNTAGLPWLYTVYVVPGTRAELSRQRLYGPKIFTLWPFLEKVAGLVKY